MATQGINRLDNSNQSSNSIQLTHKGNNFKGMFAFMKLLQQILHHANKPFVVTGDRMTVDWQSINERLRADKNISASTKLLVYYYIVVFNICQVVLK